jgi:hypothetical protein
MQRAEQRRRGSKLSGAEWKQRRRRRPRPRGFPRVRRAPRHACNVAGQLLFCLANVSVKVSRARHRAAIWRRPGKGAPKGDGCARGGRSSGLGARGSRGSGGGGDTRQNDGRRLHGRDSSVSSFRGSRSVSKVSFTSGSYRDVCARRANPRTRGSTGMIES